MGRLWTRSLAAASRAGFPEAGCAVEGKIVNDHGVLLVSHALLNQQRSAARYALLQGTIPASALTPVESHGARSRSGSRARYSVSARRSVFPGVAPAHRSGILPSGVSCPHPFRRRFMAASYTAVIQQQGEWWIGWIEEVPGVNSQGQTREELLDNLRDALEEALEMNRADARAAASGAYEEVSIPA